MCSAYAKLSLICYSLKPVDLAIRCYASILMAVIIMAIIEVVIVVCL